MECPKYVKNCIKLLEAAGFSAYAVGGAVRDMLIGVEPSDWDVTTSATPGEILSVFSDFRTVPTGIKHGTVTVILEEGGVSHPIEITTFRIDGEYLDARHPESVSFSRKLSDDLSRRDFTVNAMAFNEGEGVIDPFGGGEDLALRIIRAVGDPEKRFSEDALRILRAFRFSSQLGFKIEEKTLLAARDCAHLLRGIARERIGAEMKKLLSHAGASYSVRAMVKNGVWQALFPYGTPSDSDIELISRVGGGFEVRLAVLLCGYGDAEREDLLCSLRLSNAEKRLVLRLCRARGFEVTLASGEADARQFIHLFGNVLPDALEALRTSCEGDIYLRFSSLVEAERAKNVPTSISSLAVGGDDLLPICEGKERLMGRILSELLRLVIEDPSLNEREKLISLAKEIFKKQSAL